MSLEAPSGFYNFNWIGVDPGLTNCGTAVYRILGREVNAIEPRTIVNNKVKLPSHFTDGLLGDRRLRLDRLYQAFAQLVRYENPVLVACESPFYNSASPNAYGSLMETVGVLRMATESVSPDIPFVMYAPHEVKKAFGAQSKKGKEPMREALESKPELLRLMDTPVELLDEHSIDAVAVGYTWIMNQPGGHLWF